MDDISKVMIWSNILIHRVFLFGFLLVINDDFDLHIFFIDDNYVDEIGDIADHGVFHKFP